jgi:hypothetical protein
MAYYRRFVSFCLLSKQESFFAPLFAAASLFATFERANYSIFQS